MAVTRVRWRLAKMPKEYLRGLLRVAGSLWPHTSALGHIASGNKRRETATF